MQLGLLIVAFICIPWMLLAKPLILRHEHHKIRAMGYRRPLEDTSIATEEDIDFGASSSMPEEMHEEEEFDFGEHMVHQVIHTIEFCLGCISIQPVTCVCGL